MITTHTEPRLEPDPVKKYHHDGYLDPTDFISKSEKRIHSAWYKNSHQVRAHLYRLPFVNARPEALATPTLEMFMKTTILMLCATCFPVCLGAAEPGPLPHDLALDLGHNITLKLVLIPAGTFQMGSPDGDKNGQPNERPQHEVTISKAFYLSVYPVTQEQYEAVLGADNTANPGVNVTVVKGPEYPEQPMTYDAITAFLQALSQKSGKKVRLNTEAEWEYACRAGTQTTWFFGDDDTNANDYGWFKPGPGENHPQPVGRKKPNPWGLYDMIGNSGEVCSDWGGHYPKPTEADYTKNPVTDPTGPAEGVQHISRGGAVGWDGHCRSAGDRGSYVNPISKDHLYDFRVVVEVQ